MALPSALWRTRRLADFVGAAINVIFALISIVVLALLVAKMQAKFGIDLSGFVID